MREPRQVPRTSPAATLVLLLPLLALLPACQCGEVPLVRVEITYGGFEPRCVKLTARDISGAGEQTRSIPVPPGSQQGTLVVAVFGQRSWTSQLQFTVEARELDCGGRVVASDNYNATVRAGQTVTVPMSLNALDQDGDGYIAVPAGTDCDDGRAETHPGAPELCNDLDDNCVGGADEIFNKGSSCGGDAGSGCQQVVRCALDGGTICAAGNPWYPDGDRDGWGVIQGVTYFCGDAGAGFAGLPGDCKDDEPRVHPGLTEVCDGLDNDCLNGVDDGLDLGAPCAAPYGCTGQKACGPGYQVICRGTDAGATGLHPDEDGDGRGAPVEVCVPDGGASFVASADDCDDGDPFTAAGFPEICDRRDNDCDGRPDRDSADASACPPNPGWPALAAGGGGHHWRSVWSWTDGGLWAAGIGGRHRHHLPSVSTSTWENNDGDCNFEINSVWADPGTGVSYVVAPGSDFAAHQASPTTTCQVYSSIESPALSDPWAVVGFGTGLGAELYVVGRSGGTMRWLADGGPALALDTIGGVQLNDIHGVSPGAMFAAGVALGSPPDPRLNRFSPPRSWVQTPLPDPLPGSGASVDAVYVVSPRLAYAVTDGGHVLRWDGNAWGLQPAPPDAGPLRGVLAFGTSSVFVISNKVAWEWNGAAWSKLFDAGTAELMVDLHGTNPADIWVAVDPGNIYHWPR